MIKYKLKIEAIYSTDADYEREKDFINDMVDDTLLIDAEIEYKNVTLEKIN